jgi:mono/diheme cytochrome c family protein
MASAVFVGFVAISATPSVMAQANKAVAMGEKVYADQKCSVCHSIAGKGNAKGSLDDVGSRLSDEEIRQWLINTRVMTEKSKSVRKPVMPAYTKLSKEEVDGLVAYLKTLKKK